MKKLPETLTLLGEKYVLRSEPIYANLIRVLYRPEKSINGNPPIVHDGKSLFLLSSIDATEEKAKEDLYQRLELCSKVNKDIDKALK